VIVDIDQPTFCRFNFACGFSLDVVQGGDA
jgi:hypothetical protein